MKRFVERCRLPTRHTSTPTERFVLRADSIRPYNCGGCAARVDCSSTPTVGGYTQPGTCEYPGLRADSIRPYRDVSSLYIQKRRNHCGRAFYPIYFMVSSPFS